MSLPLSTIGALPAAPSRSDPATFNSRAEAFAAALSTLRSDINTVVGEINGGLATATIVGTVSQSGGSPTGAIIEQGSNANGEYVRLADGTQIAWENNIYDDTLNAGAAVSGTVTLPATFTSGTRTAICAVSGQGTEIATEAAAERVRAAAASNSTTTLAYGIANTSGTNFGSCRFAYVVMGRWF